METKYRCKDNDCIIKVFEVDGKIDELWIKVKRETCWTVIGYDDLTEAVNKLRSKFYNKRNYEITN